MELQIINTQFVRTRVDRYKRSSSKLVKSTAEPALEIIVYNDNNDDIYITSIDLEYNRKKISFVHIVKSKPILVQEEFKKKVTLDFLISKFNEEHKDNIDSLIGGKIIVTDNYSNTVEKLIPEF